MRFTTLATLSTVALSAALMGPPHLHITPVAGTPAMGAKALTIELEHHHQLDQLTVTARAITQRNSARVEQPLTLTRTDSAHFTVPRTWDGSTPWVVVIAAEQGPNGAHGVAEALVSIDRTGAVRGIEYTTPGFIERTGEPRRVTREHLDRTLRALLP